MANREDPDQTALLGGVWSESVLFTHGILSETLVFKILGYLPYDKSSGVLIFSVNMVVIQLLYHGCYKVFISIWTWMLSWV